MGALQWIKMAGWIVFYVALPLMLYPLAALLAGLNGHNFSMQDLILRGDALFLVVMLLATTIDDTAVAARVTPKQQLRAGDHICFLALLLSLVFYASVYGCVVAARLRGTPHEFDSPTTVWFYVASVFATALLCGSQRYFLLKTGRL